MRSILFIVWCSLFLNMYGCIGKGPYYVFRVENNVDYDIVLHYRIYEAIHMYPDTLFTFEKIRDKILIKSHSYSEASYAHHLDIYVKRMPQDTMSFFFFHADTLDKYPIEVIQRDYRILRRYDLSSQDVIALKKEYGNPVIPYPPDERMKNMKM